MKELHPNFRALREEDYPAKQGSPPANVREKEEALSEILKRHSRTPSPDRPPAEGEEGPNILGRSPEKIVADQRAVEEQEMMKTLAQN